MTKLIELTKDFKVSRPVFRLLLSEDRRNIDANTAYPIYPYTPTPIQGDILSELVCNAYNEHFNLERGSFVIEGEAIADRVMSQIRGDLAKFIEKNLEMRNPRQSKLYRWVYRNMENSIEINDTLVMVYKYIRSFTAKHMQASDTNHVNNAIAVLEAIMEKYDK